MFNAGYSGDSSPTLTNVTFSGNSATQHGGAMVNYAHDYGASNPGLINTILYGNTAASGPQMYNRDATDITFAYSLVHDGCPTGCTDDGNLLTSDPKFVNAASGDLRLKTGSPAIDVGDNAAVSGVVTDLASNPRIVNEIVDMGAYEWQGGSGNLSSGGDAVDNEAPRTDPTATSEVCCFNFRGLLIMHAFQLTPHMSFPGRFSHETKIMVGLPVHRCFGERWGSCLDLRDAGAKRNIGRTVGVVLGFAYPVGRAGHLEEALNPTYAAGWGSASIHEEDSARGTIWQTSFCQAVASMKKERWRHA
jgi:hypothetical protein